jgi:PAS domain-containing protein
MPPRLITIPTTDAAFHRFVQRTRGRTQPGSVPEFEARLKRTYPRAVVRERGLTGEPAAWYVYRDGAWRRPDGDAWWDDPTVPHIAASPEGWIESMNRTARDLLGIESDEPRHFTDFVVPGGLDDAVALFEIVRATGALEATILLQPTTGDAIAVDVRVRTDGDRGGVLAVFRLAGDLDAAAGTAPRLPAPDRVEYLPRTDVAFRSYAERALARMPEPTTDGLALRLRRLYPHAHVEQTGDGWLVRRDREAPTGETDAWWEGAGLPRVRYDSMALILEANPAAATFFGRPLVGHHWQEFVTAGSSEEVSAMLAILAEVGAAESRFRMPRGDGSLLEFDSYTVVTGDELTTVFRPAASAINRA